MAVVFGLLALLGYLGFLIDGRELGDVMRQGGWAVAILYVIVFALIYAVLVSPAAVATGVVPG